MPRLCFIVNPTAGHGRALATWNRIEPLAASLGEYAVKFTEGPGHGKELARAAALEGFDRVVVLGGDGTVNDVANGLVRSPAALAVVPTGTGNDWVRTAGVPRDPEAAVRIAFSGRRAKSDVGLVVEQQRYFFNVTGLGFDAEVIRRVNQYGPVLKSFGGALPHLLGVVGALFHFTGAPVRFELDGQPLESPRMLLMAVGIARYFGGGMKILPHAEIDDGLFEIVWGEDLSRLELIGLVGKIFSGGHEGHPKVRFARGRRIVAFSDRPVAVQMDGDLIGQLPITMELLPGALDVILPA